MSRKFVCLLAFALLTIPLSAQDGSATSKPSATTGAELDMKPTLLRRAGDYSENHPVIVIAIAKGQKETKLTGNQIGDKLSESLRKIYNAPSEYLVEAGGDYTAIGFFVKGHLYGPYGLKESLSGMTLAADAYDAVLRPKTSKSAR